MSDNVIPHSRPTMGKEEVKAVSEIMVTGHIAQGREVEALEIRLADYFGVKGAVLVSSGTSAIHLGLNALGIASGDEVILPSFVCTAPLNAVYMSGAIPIFCDIEPDSYNISVEDMKDRITDKTKAVIVPHMFGNTADLEKIIETGVPVIEDCAHAAGSFYGDYKAGSFGRFSILSFYVNKVLGCGEGGAFLSDDEELLETVRDRRSYDEKEDYKLRYNYKMTDIQAGIAAVQLSKLDDMISLRKEKAKRYSEELKGLDVILPRVEFDHIYYRYVIRCRIGLNKIISHMKEKCIVCARPVYKPLHRYFEARSGFRNTDEAYSSALSIPIYPSLTDGEQSRVIEALKEVIGMRP